MGEKATEVTVVAALISDSPVISWQTSWFFVQ
jgi:hypothetical protein